MSFVCAIVTTPATARLAANDATLDSAIRINAANALVREGKAAEAIADYQKVPVTDKDREPRTYNLGVAEYRAGNIDAAKTHFTEAAASSQATLAARSRYNLGNCFYSEAVKAAEQDKSMAIDALRQAIGHYRGSLAVEPNHTDARANIELAGQLLRKLQEEQKQEQQQQEQQQQEQQ
ncbi:MAG: hypothetical protein KDA72_21060, partial [Planctomycetales bacterium]|nr:hypothetical protein [Planctomycetales bacterium]